MSTGFPTSQISDGSLAQTLSSLFPNRSDEVDSGSANVGTTSNGATAEPSSVVPANSTPNAPPQGASNSAPPSVTITDKTMTAINMLNEKYAVVNYSGNVDVIYQEYDESLERVNWVFMSRENFKALYSDDKAEVVVESIDEKSGTTKTKTNHFPLGSFWFNSKLSRKYKEGIFFDPKGRQVEGKLNLWTGFRCESIQKAKGWSKLRHHIFHNICRGNKRYFRYLIRWMAYAVQHPDEQGHVAVVIRGLKGTGKGVFASAVQRLFGRHGLRVDKPEQLTGRFNFHLKDCILLFVDEGYFAGDKSCESTLKSAITESELAIEKKGYDIVPSKNMLHIIIVSNDPWVVRASLEERRYFVLEIGNDHMQDKSYFRAIEEQLNDGGYEAMLHDLMHMDLSDWEIRDVPQTKALVEQKIQSLETNWAWLFEIAQRGYVYETQLGITKLYDWTEFATNKLLYKSYKDFCRVHGRRHFDTEKKLGHWIKREAGLKWSRPRIPHIIGEVKDSSGSRAQELPNQPGYVFGTHEAFVSLLNSKLGIGIKKRPTKKAGKKSTSSNGATHETKKTVRYRWGSNKAAVSEVPTSESHVVNEHKAFNGSTYNGVKYKQPKGVWVGTEFIPDSDADADYYTK
jgi:hypothetical protein